MVQNTIKCQTEKFECSDASGNLRVSSAKLKDSLLTCRSTRHRPMSSTVTRFTKSRARTVTFATSERERVVFRQRYLRRPCRRRHPAYPFVSKQRAVLLRRRQTLSFTRGGSVIAQTVGCRRNAGCCRAVIAQTDLVPRSR